MCTTAGTSAAYLQPPLPPFAASALFIRIYFNFAAGITPQQRTKSRGTILQQNVAIWSFIIFAHSTLRAGKRYSVVI